MCRVPQKVMTTGRKNVRDGCLFSFRNRLLFSLFSSLLTKKIKEENLVNVHQCASMFINEVPTADVAQTQMPIVHSFRPGAVPFLVAFVWISSFEYLPLNIFVSCSFQEMLYRLKISSIFSALLKSSLRRAFRGPKMFGFAVDVRSTASNLQQNCVTSSSTMIWLTFSELCGS